MRLSNFVLTASLTAVNAIPSYFEKRDAAPAATIKNGTLEGISIPSFSQEAFLRIPFAEPPVGDLRFATPRFLTQGWNGTLEAKTYPQKCVGYGTEQIEDGGAQGEDCLYLNVVRPAGMDSGSALPVAVWIHGGGFSQGGTIKPLYNISYMIQNGIEIDRPFIGVTLQYRLNAYGFLNGDQVKAAGATNLGIRDQRLALQWVQENIAAFGGNPDKVTIFGESAGAASVGIHLVAYGGRNDKLFRGAVMESGGPLLLGSKYNASLEQSKYDMLVQATGCSRFSDSLECLRDLDYTSLNAALNGTAANTFFPYEDGDLIQGSLYDQLEAGKFVQVPIIIGTNTEEGGFTASGMKVDTDAQFRDAVASYGSNETVPFIEALYPNIPAIGIPARIKTPTEAQGKQYKRLAAFTGDYTFIAPRRLTCQSWAQHNVTAYCYRFNGDLPSILPTAGATHWVEVAYVFYNLDRVSNEGTWPIPEDYKRLAKLVSSMWVSFFVDGDPNGHGQKDVAKWPAYADGDTGYAEDFAFDVNGTSKPELDTWRAEGIAYLNSVYGSAYNK
ncbi:uncharacterized protein N0V89_011518 [Didymosphaeria variabile]|uniref:Carboxylic ester hydrolase n=1 Tax=Didymosphaeria variabile TaxID=1932322 RepID=A0A9W8XBF5_9PLEO|nr:uncharacterized protein N0V89_011518 [Didymosphaeria variabile]KAJ4345388.1 hypothetical protein N0V89_011518 [Didymosphaeria variabile]